MTQRSIESRAEKTRHSTTSLGPGDDKSGHQIHHLVRLGGIERNKEEKEDERMRNAGWEKTTKGWKFTDKEGNSIS